MPYGKAKWKPSRKWKAAVAKAAEEKLIAPSTELITWADTIDLASANNQKAKQTMWCMNQVQAGNAGSSWTINVPAKTFTYGLVDDPVVVRAAFVHQGATPQMDDKLMLTRYMVKHQFTNAGTNWVELTEYRVKSRHDVGPQGGGLDNYITNGSVGVYGNAVGSSAITYDMYGATPFDLPFLCKQWKVLRTRTKRLYPGQTHTYTYFNNKDRWVGANSLQATITAGTTEANLLIKKGQVCSLFRARAGPAGGHDGDPVTFVGLSHGPGEVHLVSINTIRVTYRYLDPAEKRDTAQFMYMGSIQAGALPGPVINTHEVAGTSAGTANGVKDADLDS